MSIFNDTRPLVPNQAPAGGGGVEITPSTAQKRRERFRPFERWCAPLRLPALPTTTNVLARYVDEHAGGVVFYTLRTRVEAIKAVHLAANAPWIEDDGPARRALARAREAGGTRASLPLVERDLADLAHLLGEENGVDALRDWAIVAFGAEAGRDGREIGTLTPDDVVFDAAGATLPSLAGPWGDPPRVLRRAEAERCPIRALEVCATLRDPAAPTLFHALDADGGAVTLRAVDVTAIVRRRMHAIGRDSRKFSAGSLKAHRFFGRSPARVAP